MNRLNQDEIVAMTDASTNEQEMINLKNRFKAEVLAL